MLATGSKFDLFEKGNARHGEENECKDYSKQIHDEHHFLITGIILLSISIGSAAGFLAANVDSVLPEAIKQKINVILPVSEDATFKTAATENTKTILLEDSALVDVASNSLPAVVSIMITKEISNLQNNSLFDPFWGGPISEGNQNLTQTDGVVQKQVIGNGSGFVITSDGMVLTNKHVVKDKQAEFNVIMQDGKKFSAKVLAEDPVNDVAILKIEANGLPVLKLGNSDSIKIGQTVLAIGDSLGEFSNSVSRGIISGLKRNINATNVYGDSERLTDIIQTDAAINLGNSGGPLIDMDGKVIGINVAIAQGAENIAFALPINQVARLVDQVKSGSKIAIPYLGVRYIVIDPLTRVQANLPFDYGILVTRGEKITDLAVLPGSPADLAGIVENDIILEINGEKLTKDNQLGDVIARLKVDDIVNLRVWHKGQERDISVTLKELKQ